MMIMTTWQGVVTIIMAILGTILTRFLPFLVFPESKEAAAFHHLSGHGAAIRHDRSARRVFAQGRASAVRQPRHSRIACDYGDRSAARMEKKHAAVDRRWHRCLHAVGAAGILMKAFA